ncbi:MAG: PAS domain-containing protein [Rhizobacter sp.]|nr:PAS domain-containing protein [Rhizobacter sp.]
MKQSLPPPARPSLGTAPVQATPLSMQEMADLFTQFVAAERHVLWVIDTQPREQVHYVSPAFESLWGISAEALYADSRIWLTRVHPDDRDKVTTAFACWVASPLTPCFDVEYRLVRADGSQRWLHSLGHPPLASNPHVGRCTGISEDITERKRADASLLVAQQRLAAIAAVAPGVLCSFRRNRHGQLSVPYGGPRMAELFGLPGMPLDKDGAPAWERIHPDDISQINERLDESSRHLSTWRTEFRVRLDDGAVRWLEGHATPMAQSNGSFLWHGTITDITERHHTQEEIVRLNSELERRVIERTAELQAAVKEIEAFSYSVSHDLRAPLRALDGFSQVLLEEHGKLLPDEGKRYLGIIRSTAQKMGHLIDDLLAFSRLGRQALTRRRINSLQLVGSAFDTLAAQREGRQIEWRLGELADCDGDLSLLRQVWINLIGNAIKYTSQSPKAVIEVGSQSRADGATEFFVRDNGAGFDMQYVHKLFGVFERLHRSDEFEGTGVGLAIVQRIVQRHGGEVRAEGEVGRGATFYFTLGEDERGPE